MNHNEALFIGHEQAKGDNGERLMGLTVKELRDALRGLSDNYRVIISVEDDNLPVPIIHETEALFCNYPIIGRDTFFKLSGIE
jgi:hypothetical protein